MTSVFFKTTGISLILGAILAITTMALHPSGGSIEHILNIATPLEYVHALGILSLPFMSFGFYGLSRCLQTPAQLSRLGYTFMNFGLIAAMLAAILNGLALPFFLQGFVEDIEGQRPLIKGIMRYGFSLNKALDYVFIGASYAAIAIFSIPMIQSKRGLWLGYTGLVMLILMVIGMCSDFMFTSLTGFRIVVFAMAAWMLIAGGLLWKSKK